MALSGKGGGKKATDFAKIKFLSRTKVYQGKTFRDFTARFEVNGIPVLVSFTKEEGVDMIYPVGSSTGEQATEKKTGHPLYVVYGRVTELPRGYGANGNQYNKGGV